jgi:hypothetical protein
MATTAQPERVSSARAVLPSAGRSSRPRNADASRTSSRRACSGARTAESTAIVVPATANVASTTPTMTQAMRRCTARR